MTKAEMIETVLLAWEDADPDTARLRLARLAVEALLRSEQFGGGGCDAGL